MESYWRNGVMGKSWVFSAASSVKTARSSATKFREKTLQECREHTTVRATLKQYDPMRPIGEMTSRGNHENSMVRTPSEPCELVKPLQRDDVLERS
jgi:hypothetical protein